MDPLGGLGLGRWTGSRAGTQELSKGLMGPSEQIMLVRVKGLLGKYMGIELEG